MIAGWGCRSTSTAEPLSATLAAPTTEAGAASVPSLTPTEAATPAGAAGAPSFKAYYYTLDDSSQETSTYRIYKVAPNLGEADILLSSFAIAGSRHRVITDSWKDDTVMFVVNGEKQSTIYSVDVAAEDPQPKELVTIPVDGSIGESLGDARFVDDGNALAFVTQEGREARAENSTLLVISLEDHEEKETYLLSVKSPLYGGFRFRAATPDSEIIYLDEIGGDGPMVWSQWYRVDRRFRSVEPLEDLPPMAIHGFRPVSFAFSPDGSKLAYADFSVIVDDSDLELPGSADGGMPGSCLRTDSDALEKYESEGGTISIRDLETGSTSEVFRNLAYSNNYQELARGSSP
jgi:Tol biopolymer transport system component